MNIKNLTATNGGRGPGQRIFTDKEAGKPGMWLASWRHVIGTNDFRVWGPKVEVKIVHSRRRAIEEMYRIATVIRMTK